MAAWVEHTRLHRTNIMVVDDNVDFSEALSDFLSSEGYAVTLASGGKEALRLLPNLTRPFGILLDLEMPGMNGVEFYKAMSAVPAFAQIPVVVFASDLSLAPIGLARVGKGRLSQLLPTLAALF